MNLSTAVDESARFARQRKEDTVREAHDDERPDIAPQVVGWRGEHPVATFMPTNGAREIILHAGQILTMGLGCDLIAVTTEGWRATDPDKNPITGKPWEHGDMENVAVNHDGIDKGWITEMLNIIAVNKAGDLASALIEFQVFKKRSALGLVSWDLIWGEEQRFSSLDDTGSAGVVGGYIPDTLVEFMNAPDMMTEVMSNPRIAEEFSDLSAEAQRAHADCAVIKMLPRLGYEGGAMLMSDNKERADVIEASMKQLRFIPGLQTDVWRTGTGWDSDWEETTDE